MLTQANRKSGFYKVSYLKIGIVAVMGLLLTGLKADRPAHGDGRVCRHEAIVQTESLNIFYFGMTNVINIEIPGQTADKINATLTPTDAGNLEKLEDGKYKVNLLNANDKSVKISVSQKIEGGLVKSVGATEFKVLRLPSPDASIGGNAGPVITTEELKKAEVVHADLMDFPFDDIHYTVTQFDYIYKPARGNLIRATVKGAAFPEELKQAFGLAARGDLLIVSGIEAQHGEYRRKVHGSLVYTVI